MTKEDAIHNIQMRLSDIDLSEEDRTIFQYLLDQYIIENAAEIFDIE